MKTKKEISSLDIAAGIFDFAFFWFVIPVALMSIMVALASTL